VNRSLVALGRHPSMYADGGVSVQESFASAASSSRKRGKHDAKGSGPSKRLVFVYISRHFVIINLYI
jgi:hypothetical protein